MNNYTTLDDLPAIDSRTSVIIKRELAEQYLIKITSLQQQLAREEENLFYLLREYGTGIISDPTQLLLIGH
jgi:hypothetical protein